jgi:hypothetical protein
MGHQLERQKKRGGYASAIVGTKSHEKASICEPNTELLQEAVVAIMETKLTG